MEIKEEYYEIHKLKTFEYDKFRDGYYFDKRSNDLVEVQDYVKEQKDPCKIFKVTEIKHIVEME